MSSTRNEWNVSRVCGDAAAFHADEPAAGRSATFFDVDRPTLVLGSTQRDTDVNERVAAALGVEVIRRRSGGGAVLLLPDEFVWLDVVIPASDPLWSADVAHAMVWVGELWHDALGEVGSAKGSEVHRGAMVTSQWSRPVCFAGVGSGELMLGAAKVVGISQRRTRSWARFQSVCHLRWRPEICAALVTPPGPSSVDLAAVAACVQAPADEIRAALSTSLGAVG